jgi:hypothetical protein
VFRTSLRLPFSKHNMADLLVRVESMLPSSVRFVAWSSAGLDGMLPERLVCDAGVEEVSAALQMQWRTVLQQKGIGIFCQNLCNHLWLARTTRGTQLMLRGQRPRGQLLKIEGQLAGEALFVVKSLEVMVVKAAGLPLMDRHHEGSCDPYAVVVFEEEDDGSGEAAAAAAKKKQQEKKLAGVGQGDGVDMREVHERNKFATEVAPQTLEPVWKQRFLLKGFTTRSGSTVTVNVFDHDDGDADDLVGSVTVDVPPVGSRLGERAYKLLGDDGVTERGLLFLALRWKA